jgi:hypothetical protein
MRELFKDIDVGDRKFRINKFDALTGSYVVYTILTQVLPMGIGKQIEGISETGNMPAMSKEKFIDLQKDCLRACSEIKPVGGQVVPVPILMADGRWGVEDLENDAPTVMILTIQVLGYNVQSFFEGNVLDTFKNSITQLNLSNA